MPSHHPVLRKPAPLQHPGGVPSLPTNISTNHPLPPLPVATPPNRLQKLESPKRHERTPSSSKPDDIRSPLPPPPIITDPAQVCTKSPNSSRPTSAHSGSDSEGAFARKVKKRSSWLPGSRSRSRNRSQEIEGTQSAAWIRQGGSSIDYSLRFLLEGQKIPELWTEDADCLIYLYPPSSGRGASFRLPSHLLSSSLLLLKMMQGEPFSAGHNRQRSFGGRNDLQAADATRTYGVRGFETPPITPYQYPVDTQQTYDEYGNAIPAVADSPKSETHLFFPSGILSTGPKFTPEEVQRLVDIRNLFAFLTQQPLIRTPQCKRLFDIFMELANNLKKLEFGNMDGSTYGEAASSAFEFYMNDLRIPDVRESREKTLEAIVLAEAMRSTELYNEAFAHAVGRYDSIKKIDLPVYHKVSQTTRNRMERSQIELKGKQASMETRLTSFEFPSLFAGIAASTTSDESKFIRFNAWKLQFQGMKRFVMKYYKDLHGSWPPKASNKKNQFAEGGLNRLVISILYKDLCQLYSLLVDRSAITTRSNDEISHAYSNVDPTHAALRKLLSEYDHSCPPVQPAVPFDVPLEPTVAIVNPAFSRLSKTEQFKESTRKLKNNETTLILTKSHNLDADVRTSFIQAYKEFEYDQANNKNAQEMSDMRYGHWIFLYAVIQALPLLVIDAPGVQYTDGVEYFLCQPAVGNAPWTEDAAVTKRAMYRVQNGQGVVSLPSDLVDHGVEAVYRRSYCWTMANHWLGSDTTGAFPHPPPLDSEFEALSPLEPPPGLAGGQFGVRPQSRGRTRGDGSTEFNNGFASLSLSTNSGNHSRSASRDVLNQNRRSIALGLEKLPIPDGADWSPHFTPVSGGGVGYGSSRDASPTLYGAESRHGGLSAQGSVGAGVNGWASATTLVGGPASGASASRVTSGGSGSGSVFSSGGNPGTTFDDILGAIENAKPAEKGKKGKKK